LLAIYSPPEKYSIDFKFLGLDFGDYLEDLA
jgi:hypothetical protein